MAPALAGFWLAPRLLAMGWLDRLAARVERRTGWVSVGGLPALRAGPRRHLAPPLRAHGCPADPHGDLVRRRAGNLAGALICSAIRARSRRRSTIESLGHAVKAAGFLIPGAWGVQEGGFIALCAAFGIASPTAIALSLIKRIPDFVLRRARPLGLAADGRIEPARSLFREKLSPQEEPHGL